MNMLKFAVFQSMGSLAFIMGSLFTLIALMVGQILASLILLGVAVGGYTSCIVPQNI